MGFRQTPPITRCAHMVRAILLASATATRLKGLRNMNSVRQGGNVTPRLPSLTIDVAPMMRSVLSCRLPRLLAPV